MTNKEYITYASCNLRAGHNYEYCPITREAKCEWVNEWVSVRVCEFVCVWVCRWVSLSEWPSIFYSKSTIFKMRRSKNKIETMHRCVVWVQRHGKRIGGKRPLLSVSCGASPQRARTNRQLGFTFQPSRRLAAAAGFQPMSGGQTHRR